jgi:aminoglycoside 2'-N-acetyltransferase I
VPSEAPRIPATPVVRRLGSDDLTERQVSEIRDLLERAFGTDEEDRFRDSDWAHALGGTHFLLEAGDRIVAHAAVVERQLHLGDRAVRAGYVEAVATDPAHQRTGHGSRLMADVGEHIRDHYELGALGTDVHAFYERLGWRTWRGPTSVRTDTGLQRTPEEDGYVMVLPTPSSPPLDLDAAISCDWRPGDAW